MHLFDTLKDEYHQYSMDNLYNLTAFCKAATNRDRKVLYHGVIRKGMRDSPFVIQQEEVESRVSQIHIRGMVKATVLEVNLDYTNLVVSNIYNSKPVHYLKSSGLRWRKMSTM